MDLETFKLKDLCEVSIGRTPPRKEFKWFNTGLENDFKWISIKDLGNCNKMVCESSETLSAEAQKKFNIPIVKKNTIVLSFKLTVGRIGIVKYDMLTNEAIAQLPIKDKNLLDNDFLYYYLKIYPWNILGNTSSIATAVNSSIIKNISITIPNLKFQKKIVKLLNNLDKKIELNNKINDNLLKLSLSIYDIYFNNCNDYGCIGDYCKIKSGYAFKSSDWLNCGIKVVKIKSILQDTLNLDSCSFVDRNKINIAKDFLVKPGDLVIAMTGATIGKFTMIPYIKENLIVNQRVGKFFLGNNPIVKLPYIYCTLKQYDVNYELINKGQGSAQPNISGNDIMKIKCKMPKLSEITNFNKILSPLFELYVKNQYQNNVLINLRDTILPKLMSGEIDVSNIDI